MTPPQPGPTFLHLGDWLIWRATGPLGDFRMTECIRVIQTEAARDGWLYQIQTHDIERILARYKEHVTYWNISISIIQAELNGLTQALDANHNYFEIATLFDAGPSKRYQPEFG